MRRDVMVKKLSRFVVLVKLFAEEHVDLGLKYTIRVSNKPPVNAVRAGSVVLLVGVGSLVCWRLWAHWRYGSEDGELADSTTPQGSPNASPNKAGPPTGAKRPGLLASLLEEELFQESEDVDEDDPAFIQQLLGLLKESMRDAMLGRYFGPDSPGFQSQQRMKDGRLSGSLLNPPTAGLLRSQRTQLLGEAACASDATNSRNSSSTSTPSDQRYLADHSSSASSRDMGHSSSSGDENMAEARAAARSRRRKKRLQKSALRHSGSSGPGEHVDRKGNDTRPNLTGGELRLSSSVEREQVAVRFYANAGTDEEYSTDGHRDESEGVWAGASYSDLMERMRHRQARRSLSREPSICSNLSDVLNSPGSHHRRFPFKRDDSVCSNLSDFTVSECSEMSMDVSVKEEVNNTFRFLEEIEQDLDELKSSVLQMDEEVAMFVTKPDPYSLKMTFSDYSLSSKDENDSLPYIHNNSQSSSISEPREAAATGLAEPKKGKRIQCVMDAETIAVGAKLGVLPKVEGDAGVPTRSSDTDAEGSLEWDSPRHGWSSMQIPAADTAMQKEDGLVSLEWDDGAVKQHPEPSMMRPLTRDDSSHNFHDNTVVRSQLLPYHSSMELDLEEELEGLPSLSPEQQLSLRDYHPETADPQYTTVDATSLPLGTSPADDFNTVQKSDPSMTASTDSAIVTSMTASGMTSSTFSNNDMTSSFTIAANMTGSTDSAIYSGPGSRSATASPLPAMLSQSTLSSSGIGSILSFGSCCDTATPDGEEEEGEEEWQQQQQQQKKNSKSRHPVERAASVGGSISDRARVGECGRRSGPGRWSSEESGFAEPDSDGPHGCLSPVREVREKENSESSSSSPRHLSSSLTNLCETSNRHSTEGLNLMINDNDNYDSLNGNGITQQLSRNQSGVSLNNTINQNLNETSNFYPTETFDNSSSHLASQFNDSGEGGALDENVTSNELHDTLNGNDEASAAMGNRATGSTGGSIPRRRSLSPASRQIMTIGEKISLEEYSAREWQGNTAKANTIRQGYSKIGSEVGLSMLRCIRGDQYCGIRATVFQALTTGHSLPRGAPALARLVAEVAGGATWLMGWTFANRLHYGNALDGIRDCLETLDNVSDDLVGCNDRASTLEEILNETPRLDLQLCEAVKLHMLASALQLYGANSCGSDVPLFAMIMFARQSSQTPAELMKNHLNVVGDTGGLEQIEMFLLGHCLKATLQVVRPASYGAEDFICYYPDTNIGVWPQLTLIAEDDRHYNVIVE